MDFDIIVFDVPEDRAWSGEEPYDVKSEALTYEARFRCEPLMAYCYQCTKTMDYDSKWREHRPRKMTAGDYKQSWKTIADDTSETGFTNQCLHCGFRMSEYDGHEGLIPEPEEVETTEMEWVNEGYLHDGAWWIAKTSFFDLMKRGFGKEINYAFVIEGQARIMPIHKLVEMAKTRGFREREGTDDLGIPTPLFQTM